MAQDKNGKWYNPLKEYQTYAYHHILIACDSTETATEIEKAGNITELQRTRQQKGSTTNDKYRGQDAKNGGRFVVLIDGLVDAEFYVDSAEWSTYIAPTEEDQHSMIATGGSIQIHEPFGVAFMERLVNLGSELLTDMTGIVFLLKTVFVGYKDDNPPHYHVTMLPQYRPFIFTMTNITSVITETGSHYEMTIFGAANGFAKLPHVSSMGNGMSVVVNSNDSVGQALRNTFDEMNRLYLAEAEQLGVILSTGGKSFAEGGQYRQVLYSVSADDYEDTKYIAGSNENTLTENTNKQKILHFGENVTIDSVVDAVMRSSKEVMEDAGSDGKKYIYKISSMMNSTPKTMKIEYQVNRYLMITTPYSDIQDKLPSQIPANQIRTYDYIFTGQNTNILELDIKMNMGMSFFHTASSLTHPVNQTASQYGTTQATVPGGCAGGTNSADGKPRPLTPLFLGDKINNSSVRNCAAPISTAVYQSLLEQHAFLESTAITMKITGDPGLMAEMLVTREELTEKNAGQTRQRSFLSTPIVFKINIQYPVDGTLRPFWYRGLYTLNKVVNTFEGGQFTQTLTLYSLPTSSDISVIADEPPENARDIEKGGNGKAVGSSGNASQTNENKTVRQQSDSITGARVKLRGTRG